MPIDLLFIPLQQEEGICFVRVDKIISIHPKILPENNLKSVLRIETTSDKPYIIIVRETPTEIIDKLIGK